MGGKRIKPALEKRANYLIKAYKSGKSIDDIAMEFPCSPTSIRRFLIKHKTLLRPAIRPKKLNPFRKQIEALYREGKNTRQIAKIFNTDRNTVSTYLNYIGIRRHTPLSKRTFYINGEANKGILAGLLVGEGSIITRGNSIAIRIVNTDKGIIDWLAQWGGKVYRAPIRERCPKPCFIWDLSATVNVFHCLNLIFPYIVGQKRKLAQKAIQYLEQTYNLQINSLTCKSEGQ